MAAKEFIIGAAGQEAERKLLITAVNVSETPTTPEWEIIGIKTEESSIEFNADVETITDILGVTTTTIKKTEPKQTVEPNTIRQGSKLCMMLDDIMEKNELPKLQMFEVIIVRGYKGTVGAYNAEVHTGCSIIPTSLGGSGTVDFPYEINLSNNKTFGTIDKLKTGFTFKETTTIGI